jgi:hypothetical protein
MQQIAQQLIAASKRLVSEIGALRQSVDSIRDQQERQDEQCRNQQQPEPPPVVVKVRSELEIPETEKAAERTHNKRILTVQWVQVVVTFLAFIAAAVYAGITANQLSEMKNATKLATQSGDAARFAMQLDERAWIVPMYSELKLTKNAPIVVPAPIINSGKTAAKDVSMKFGVELLKTGEDPDLAYKQGHYSGSVGALFPNNPQPLGLVVMRMNGRTAFPLILTPAMHRKFGRGELWIAIYGDITYRDVFGTQHWMQFCFQASGTQINTGSDKCRQHNDTDDNWKR